MFSRTATSPFIARSARAFRNIADADPDRCVVIDASAPRRSVQAAIWKEVRTRFATDLKAVAADAAAGAGTAS